MPNDNHNDVHLWLDRGRCSPEGQCPVFISSRSIAKSFGQKRPFSKLREFETALLIFAVFNWTAPFSREKTKYKRNAPASGPRRKWFTRLRFLKLHIFINDGIFVPKK